MKIAVRLFKPALWARVAIGVLLSTAGISWADIIIVPNANATTEGGSRLGGPFSGGQQRWQQIYLRSEFESLPPGPVSITSIRYRIDSTSVNGSFSTIAEGIRILMSTTAVADFSSISKRFADNIGADVVEVLPRTDLPLSATRSGAAMSVIIPLQKPFVFEKGNNLLVDIDIAGISNTSYFDANDFASGTFGLFGGAGFQNATDKTTQGLITGFTFLPVPEPHFRMSVLIASLFFACLRRKTT